MRTLVIVGKIGPAFGDRASFVEIEAFEYVVRIANWETWNRADALRAAFDELEQFGPLFTVADLSPRCEYCGFPASYRATLDFTRHRFVCATHAETLHAPFPRDYAIEAI